MSKRQDKRLFELQNIQDHAKQILSPPGFYFLGITQKMLASRTHPVTAQWFSYTHLLYRLWPLAFSQIQPSKP